MPRTSRIRWIRPKQARSRETLDRLCDAAEHLLVDTPFDQLRIEDITARAESSVGSFYTRFPNKDVFFEYLVGRYLEEVSATLDELLAESRWDGKGLEPRVEALVALALHVARHRVGLFRALVHRAQIDAQVGRSFLDEPRLHLLDRLRDFVLEAGDEIGHPDPQGATKLGIFTVLTTIQQLCLFSDAPHARDITIDDDTLTTEMIHLFLRYVQASGERSE